MYKNKYKMADTMNSSIAPVGRVAGLGDDEVVRSDSPVEQKDIPRVTGHTSKMGDDTFPDVEDSSAVNESSKTSSEEAESSAAAEPEGSSSEEEKETEKQKEEKLVGQLDSLISELNSVTSEMCDKFPKNAFFNMIESSLKSAVLGVVGMIEEDMKTNAKENEELGELLGERMESIKTIMNKPTPVKKEEQKVETEETSSSEEEKEETSSEEEGDVVNFVLKNEENPEDEMMFTIYKKNGVKYVCLNTAELEYDILMECLNTPLPSELTLQQQSNKSCHQTAKLFGGSEEKEEESDSTDESSVESESDKPQELAKPLVNIQVNVGEKDRQFEFDLFNSRVMLALGMMIGAMGVWIASVTAGVLRIHN